MDNFNSLLDEMHRQVQQFNQNNKILKENWQDKQSDHFAGTCITVANSNCMEFMQTTEQLGSGVNSSLEQLKSMAAELSKLRTG